MIKKIIFDLDNTLIMWKEEYIEALKKTVEKYNKNININYMDDLINKYETTYDYYDKKIFLDYINEKIEDKIDMNFIDDFLYNLRFCSEPNEKVNKILEYLGKKYELVVLTNFFQEPQLNRLKNAKMDKYFTKVYGAEKYRKPFKECFLEACEKEKPEECVMIGDNYNIDIIGAHNAGLNVIYYNNLNKQDNKLKLIEINDLEQLKSVL